MTRTIERIATVSGPGLLGSIGAIPKGATAKAESPTGYVFGAAPPGLPWVTDIASVLQAEPQFGFNIVKLTYWMAGGINPGMRSTLVEAVNRGGRWLVVYTVQSPAVPGQEFGQYVGVYAAPKDQAELVVAYGQGNVGRGIDAIRADGETLIHAGADVASAAVQAGGAVAVKALELADKAAGALAAGARGAAKGLFSWLDFTRSMFTVGGIVLALGMGGYVVYRVMKHDPRRNA